MTKWFQAIHKETGLVEYPAAEDGQESPGGYDRREWTLTPLDGEPGEHDAIVDGLRVPDEEKRSRSEKAAAANNLSRLELVERLEALAARVKALETAVTAAPRPAQNRS